MKIRIQHEAETNGYTVKRVPEETPIGPTGDGKALVMDHVQATAVAYLMVEELKKAKKGR